jgi:predicted MFS family arabinose efflux permease
LTNSFPVFIALSYITATTTVTPQLMLPLVGDLAPPARRATALSIVVSGLLGGILIARLLSGILTQYTSWRTIYWFSFGVQYLILILLYFFMPDYPSTNPDGLNYFKMLLSILKMLFKHPVLMQACIVGLFTSTIFTSFWTTLTFLLSSDPYNYSTVTIGLFALIGISAMVIGPFYVRFNLYYVIYLCHIISPQDETPTIIIVLICCMLVSCNYRSI